MIIVNKERNECYNLSHVINIYISSDGNSIKICAGNTTRGGILGKYGTYEETKKAFEMILDSIKNKSTEIIYIPDDVEVRNKLQTRQVNHHITGKKMKGHGGS